MSEPRLEAADSLGRRIVAIEKVSFLIGRRAVLGRHMSSAEVFRDCTELVYTKSATEQAAQNDDVTAIGS